MTKTAKTLPPIPAQRYFSLDELCRLAEISPEAFAQWQHEHGVVIGYGGQQFTRLDVIKVRQLKDTFAPYHDPFTENHVDTAGNPAITAVAVKQELDHVLDKIEQTLAK